jgi:dihydrolipoamide dehydrogenase
VCYDKAKIILGAAMADIFDVVVIGAGPAGYVAAIKCAQLGMRVACVESRETLGGTCLNVGCIPSKALLNASYKYYEAKTHLSTLGIKTEGVELDLNTMMGHKTNVVKELTQGIAFLFKKNNIQHVVGHAAFNDAHTVSVTHNNQTQTLSAKNFIIATGSSVLTPQNITINEETIVSSTGALALSAVPKHMVVMGGGYIGLEMASVWSRLGAHVEVVEFAARIVPAMDHDVSETLKTLLEKQGIAFHLNHKVASATASKKGVELEILSGDGVAKKLNTDVLLVSIGRKPNTANLNIEKTGATLNERGFVVVNQNYQTSAPNIYAVGDVIGGLMLAHKAEDEGVAVAEIIAGQKPHVNYGAIPAVVYTHPEVASVGKTEQELIAENIPIKTFKFPMRINSRAKANNDTEGFVKIVTHEPTDEVLGVHIIAADAGAMIAEATIAMEYRASAEDIARTCHAHPTTAEALKEAALGVWKKTLHM